MNRRSPAGRTHLSRPHEVLHRGEDGLQPWMVWLSRLVCHCRIGRGKRSSFADASRRCTDFGVDLGCHPHMLRHSFALRMLMTPIYAHDRRMGITPEERREFRLIFGDPWVLVQTLLGHANLETTRQCYLEPVSACRSSCSSTTMTLRSRRSLT